jgi:hypothetical protein
MKQVSLDKFLRNYNRAWGALLCGFCMLMLPFGLAWSDGIRVYSDEHGPDRKDPATGLAQGGEEESAGNAQSTPLHAPPPNKRAENHLTAQRDAELALFSKVVEQEQRLMLEKVHVLDEDQARDWLTSFISSQPFNCPLAQKGQWAEAIIQATLRNDITLSKEIMGLLACIIAIESGFRADPFAVDRSRGEDMAALLARAEQELREKAGPLLSVPPIPALYKQYKDRYYPKLLACRTEGEIEVVARSIADDLKRDSAKLPDFLKSAINKGTEKLVNVVRTKGSMQLNLIRARQVMKNRGEEFTDEELVQYMYTLEGGVDVGVAALKPMFVQYAAYYAAPGDLSWLFFVGMDYHYGPFSSRNMMEQIRIRDLSGCKIPLDGDFLHYDEDATPQDRDSLTLQAVKTALPSVSRDDIMKAFLLEKDPHYVYTDLHRTLSEAHRQKFGETPFAVIGELWMGQDTQLKHGIMYRTKAHLNKLDRYLNSVPWD